MANWLNDHASSDESELALVYLAMLQFKWKKFCDWLVMSAMGAGGRRGPTCHWYSHQTFSCILNPSRRAHSLNLNALLGQWIQVSREKWEAWVPCSDEGNSSELADLSPKGGKKWTWHREVRLHSWFPGRHGWQAGTELTRQWEKFDSENSPVMSDNLADQQSDAITDPIPTPSSFSNWKRFLLKIYLLLAALGLHLLCAGFF